MIGFLHGRHFWFSNAKSTGAALRNVDRFLFGDFDGLKEGTCKCHLTFAIWVSHLPTMNFYSW
jgi:hypothetical protein